MLMDEKKLKFIKKSNFLTLFYKCSEILITLPKGNVLWLKLLIKFMFIKNYVLPRQF